MEIYAQIILLIVHVSGCAMFYFIGKMVGGEEVFSIFNKKISDIYKEE